MKAAAPITGADAFLLTVERLMRRGGQGQHRGLTVVELGPGFDVERLRSATERLAAASPIAAARLARPLFRVPRWTWTPGTRAEFAITEHSLGADLQALCEGCLNDVGRGAVSFDVVPESGDGTVLVMSWRHLLLDGKGAELLLLELARLAADPAAAPRAESWGVMGARKLGWRQILGEAERFKGLYRENVRHPIRALADSTPKPGAARFAREQFDGQETARINERADSVSRGLFRLAWFLAAAIRAHRAVFLHRGSEPESYQAGCSVQQRKGGSRHPIWQNQVSQFFFRLLPPEAADLVKAAELLHEQFVSHTRRRMDLAFNTMTQLLRLAPTWWYLRFLRANSGGFITSFFYSHTGTFLPECEAFAGAPIRNGWHVPSVCAPPGTGLFFSERNGGLSATLSWRDGVLTSDEVTLLRRTLREDLLGA